MATQKGIIKLKGTLGDITFYKSKDGYIAREKGGIDANRIAKDPAFQRTRENGAEFGRAGKAGRILRTAFRPLLLNTSDARMVSRLTQQFIRVIQADATNTRGLRNVMDGETELLSGFEFNINGKLGTTFYAPYTTSIDRISGALAVSIPSFVPLNMVTAPSGTTHFKLLSGGVALDFESETYTLATSESALLAWDSTPTAVLDLTNTVTPNSTVPLFLAFGVAFYQEVNGASYPLKNGFYNPLSLVQVDGGV